MNLVFLVGLLLAWLALCGLIVVVFRSPKLPQKRPAGSTPGLGALAIAVGLGVVFVPRWIPEAPPPVYTPRVPQAPAVAPEPWPATLITAEVDRDHADPRFRHSSFEFRHVRLLAHREGVELVVDHGEREHFEPCVVERQGSAHRIELQGALEDGELVAGAHGVEGTFSKFVAYEVSGTLDVTRVEGDRVQATLDLAGATQASFGATLTGTFTAQVERCEATSPVLTGAGPSAVVYRHGSALHGPVEDTLTYATVLAGVPGLGDLLVFRTTPLQSCRLVEATTDPRMIWVTTGLPEGLGRHTLEAGLEPGRFMMKTWSPEPFDPRDRTLGLQGALEIGERTAHGIVGRVELDVIDVYGRMQGEPGPYERGTLRGPFEATVLDCASWTGPYPL